MLTYRNMMGEIENLRFALRRAEAELQNLPGYWYMHNVEAKITGFESENEVLNMLIDEINQRDEPMSHSEIREIFEHTGMAYKESHVLACNPDSEETINEQIQHYRE